MDVADETSNRLVYYTMHLLILALQNFSIKMNCIRTSLRCEYFIHRASFIHWTFRTKYIELQSLNQCKDCKSFKPILLVRWAPRDLFILMVIVVNVSLMYIYHRNANEYTHAPTLHISLLRNNCLARCNYGKLINVTRWDVQISARVYVNVPDIPTFHARNLDLNLKSSQGTIKCWIFIIEIVYRV